MSQSVEELVALGLSEVEAKRVINRNAKASAKSVSQVALAERRLPKAQEQLDHAAGRAAHWQTVAATAQAKVDKYVAIISGESKDDAPAESENEPVEVVEAEAPKARGKKSK